MGMLTDPVEVGTPNLQSFVALGAIDLDGVVRTTDLDHHLLRPRHVFPSENEARKGSNLLYGAALSHNYESHR